MKFFENSNFLKYLKKIGQNYLILEEKLNFVYINSATYKLTRRNVELIKIGFKFSVFSRITQVDSGVLINYFETSRIIKIVLRWGHNFKRISSECFAASIFFVSIRNLKDDFFLNPIKVGGIIIVITIMTGSIFSIIFKEQIALWHWLMRGLLVSVSLGGLSCDARWDDIKRTSFVLRRLII